MPVVKRPPATRAKKKASDGAEPSKLTSKAFWPLIDKWQIADEQALKLLGHQGGLTSSGKRQRFTLTTEEAKRVQYLKQIDLMLETIFGDVDWISKPVGEQPFKGLWPIDYMIKNQLPGISDVLHYLNRLALRKAVS